MEKNIKILLVDDQEDFRQLMAYWLKSKGYLVIVAPDGRTAVKLAKEEKPNILFLDLNMPVMDGAKTLKEIRTFDKDLPVIVISAYPDAPMAKEVLTYGISGIFYKGKNFEEALSLLETALRAHKGLRKK